MDSRRILSISGNDYERGFQIGEQMGSRIKVNLLNQMRHYQESQGYDFQEWIEKCQAYIPYVEQYTPHTYQEMKGMSDGSGLTFAQILALTSAYELAVAGGTITDKCTGFFVAGDYTVDGRVLCGQTNDEDLGEWIPYLDLVFRHKNPEGPSALIYTHPGIAAYMGMNDAGIAVLWQYIDNGERQMGVPTNCIIREMLFYSDLDEIVQYLQQLPHTIPNHYLVSSRDKGVASVECYPSGVFVRSSASHICHCNNILAPERMAGCDAKDPTKYRQPLSIPEMEEETFQGILAGTDGVLEWSYLRYDAICKLVEEHKGQIDVDKAKSFLADHQNEPFSICSHPNFVNTRWKTLASLVFDLTDESMSIAFGCACQEPFHTFTFTD